MLRRVRESGWGSPVALSHSLLWHTVAKHMKPRPIPSSRTISMIRRRPIGVINNIFRPSAIVRGVRFWNGLTRTILLGADLTKRGWLVSIGPDTIRDITASILISSTLHAARTPRTISIRPPIIGLSSNWLGRTREPWPLAFGSLRVLWGRSLPLIPL